MKNTHGSRYLINALGGAVAVLCLAMGLQLLSPDLPAYLATWLGEERIQNGLILALGGAMLSFLLGSGFIVAARKMLINPVGHLGSWVQSVAEGPTEIKLVEIGTLLHQAGKELTSFAEDPKKEPDSLERLNFTIEQLMDTVQQTEEIVKSINEIGGITDTPDSKSDQNRS